MHGITYIFSLTLDSEVTRERKDVSAWKWAQNAAIGYLTTTTGKVILYDICFGSIVINTLSL